MALTAGNVTIKLAGGTYPTWKAFWDDLGNLTGDITCTVDASTFTEVAQPNTVLESLNGHTLHVLPTVFPTKTDASDGARFICNHAFNVLSLWMEGPGDVIIEGMIFIGGSPQPIRILQFYVPGTAFGFIYTRNILKGGVSGIQYDDPTKNCVTKIYNNIIYDSSGGYGVEILTIAPSAVIANNTVINCNTHFDCGDEEVTLENNLNYDTANRCFYNIELLTIGDNNAADDNTGEDGDWGGGGSNNVPGIGDPFNNRAADDFTITALGDIGTAGKDLSGDFIDDFFGNTRSRWTIGACEASLLVSKGIGGTLTPTGSLSAALIIALTLGGELDLSGEFSASNPDWLLIDEILIWQGEWDATVYYGLDDVVLYKASGGNEWHVFISKITHNVGNVPTSTAPAWRRLYQEPLL